MTTIKRTLLSNYFVIIAVMAMMTVAFILVYSSVLGEQRRFSSVIQLEYGLTERAQEVVSAFNEYRNAQTAELLTAYGSSRQTLLDDLDSIGVLMFPGPGRSALDGVLNTVQQLIDTTDRGVDAIRASDFASGTTAYDEANTLLNFVPDSVSRLLIEELEITRPVLSALERRQQFALGIGVVLLIVVTFTAAGTAVSLARKISTPLERLSTISRNIAEGRQDVTVDAPLKEGGNEIADLAVAFDAMLAGQRAAVEELKQANSELTTARNKYLEKNRLLEQLNLLFITRERRISELKEQLRAAGRPVADLPGDEVDSTRKGV